MKSRRELEEKMESRRSNATGVVVEHTAIPPAETKTRKKLGPRKKKFPDPMEAVESDVSIERYFQSGCVVGCIPFGCEVALFVGSVCLVRNEKKNMGVKTT